MEPARILVVDDEPDIRDILEKSLSLSGYSVTSAADGAKALELCASFNPHVILLDVMMPDASGVETLQKIRALDRDVKVVMVSGMHDLTVAREAISLGAVDYITKPFDLRDLDSYIKTLLPEG